MTATDQPPRFTLPSITVANAWSPALTTDREAEPTDRVALSPHVLGILAKTGREYTWELHGELGGIRLASIAGLPLRGVAMPIRAEASIDDEEAA